MAQNWIKRLFSAVLGETGPKLRRPGTSIISKTAPMFRVPSPQLSRMVVFGAMLQSQKLEWPTNFSAISCIPQYTSRPGILEVTLGLTDNPFVRTFTPTLDADSGTSLSQSSRMAGLLWQSHEAALQGQPMAVPVSMLRLPVFAKASCPNVE
jgi:hypothetical protein